MPDHHQYFSLPFTVVSYITFVTVADIAQYVFQVGGASLETGAGKHFADDVIKSLETVRAYESDRSWSVLPIEKP